VFFSACDWEHDASLAERRSTQVDIISEIRIEGFRSIRDATIGNLGHFTAFAGLNNSGKSNVLRALNAFFTGFADPGQLLRVDEDYYRPDLRQKKAKRIRITVAFRMPESFRFRRDLQHVRVLLGGARFTITKEWRRKSTVPDYFLNGDGPLSLEQRQKVDQFLQLINFRYVPNRVLPVEVIRNEHRALRDVLVRRLGAKGKEYPQAFTAIGEVSRSMIEALARRMNTVYPPAQVRLATPTAWSDMAFAFGYFLRYGDIEIEDSLQGAGIQSLLMLETLYLIDRDYFQKFGWRQAAIWALEEPEASLHSSLEAQVASFLKRISVDPQGRLQILATTHSDLVLQYADRAFFVSFEPEGTRLEVCSTPGEAVERSAKAGVSRWAHPILHYPIDPLILVEGKSDRVFLERAFELCSPKRSVRIADLELVEGIVGAGGVDRLVQYVKTNASAIKARAEDAPVVVLLDWDAASKRSGLQQAFGPNDPIEILVWPLTALNPALGRTFRGIERCYSDRLIAAAERQAGIHLARRPNGVRVVEQGDEYERLKRALCVLIERDGLLEEDLAFVRPFLQDLLQSCRAM